MHLWFHPNMTQMLVEYAQAALPNECCGILLGHGGTVEKVVPIPNIAADPRVAYRMDDSALISVLYEAKHSDHEVIGFYHSHPRTDPIPSQTDIKLASYPDAAHVIVGFPDGQAHLAAWSIKTPLVQPIRLVISEDEGFSRNDELNLVEKRAIIASALIAFIFMLILSLTLLPPAPIIPLH